MFHYRCCKLLMRKGTWIRIVLLLGILYIFYLIRWKGLDAESKIAIDIVEKEIEVIKTPLATKKEDDEQKKIEIIQQKIKRVDPNIKKMYSERLRNYTFTSDIVSQGEDLKWIASRMRQDANECGTAFAVAEETGILSKITKKRILIFMGLLIIGMGKRALTGGPMGELIQWSHLIGTLHLFGHNVEFVNTGNEFNDKIHNSEEYDLIFTDFIGLSAIDTNIYHEQICKFRILDIFGTEPEFNIRLLSDRHKGMYEKYNIPDTRQLMTYLPHTPDDSFLGVIIPTREIDPSMKAENKPLKAIIYGKEPNYLNYIPETSKLLKVVSKFMEIHFTMSQQITHFPFPVINHGIMPFEKLSQLLDESHLFIGLGQPFQGPGPFEALAHGLTYIQPKFPEPHNRKTDPGFAGKPTMLNFTSQHIYLEDFVRDPYVYTLDYSDTELVKEIVTKIAKRPKLAPFVPFEFTAYGYIERLAILLQKLKVCDIGNLALGNLPVVNDDKTNIDSRELLTDGVWALDRCYRLEKATEERPNIAIAIGDKVWVWKIAIKIPPKYDQEIDSSHQIEIELVSTKTSISKKFPLDRVSIEWVWVDANSVHTIRVFSDVSIDICEIEVYGSKSFEQLWPTHKMLRPTISNKGEPCTKTCFRNQLICSRNLFPPLDKITVLERYFDCEGVKINHIGPGMDKTNCLVNDDSMLYSCAAYDPKVVRLCPCVVTHPGHNGVPEATEFF